MTRRRHPPRVTPGRPGGRPGARSAVRAGARARRAATLAALALVPGLALPGCRLGPPPGPGPLAPEVGALPGHAAAVRAAAVAGAAPRAGGALRLGVAPVRWGVDVGAGRAGGRPASAARATSPPDLDLLRAALVEALAASPLVASARPRGGPGAEPAEDAAWAAGDDALVELEVRAWWQEYLGHVRYVSWFLLWVNWVWPAWFVPVDLFGVGVEAALVVRAPRPGAAPACEARLAVTPEETAQELRPLDRGLVGPLDALALWSVEASLDRGHWEAVERHVGPHAARRVALAALDALAREVALPAATPGPAREALRARLRDRHAVVAGVSRPGDPRLAAAPWAAEDAARLAAWLASPRGGGLAPGRELAVLLEQAATPDAVLEAVARAARRAGADDEVVVWLSCLGATLPRSSAAGAALGGLAGLQGGLAPGAPCVLLASGTPEGAEDPRPATEAALPLAALGRALAGTRAARVLVVLDASFGGAPDDGPATRTGSLGRAAPRPALAEDVLEALGGAGPSGAARLVVLAARPAEAAHELPDARAGLFGLVALAGLDGAADVDGDGRVDGAELLAWVEAEVPARAELEGFRQRPLVLGDRALAPAWPR